LKRSAGVFNSLHNEYVQTHITTEIGHQNSILILQFISFSRFVRPPYDLHCSPGSATMKM